MLKVIERYINTQIKAEIKYCKKVEDEPFPWHLDIGKAQAHQIDTSTLLHIPKILRTDNLGQRVYDCGLPDPLINEQIPYWYAFWETHIHRDMVQMILSKSIPLCSRWEQKNLKYMNGQQIGQTILTEVMNGGALHAGVFMISV